MKLDINVFGYIVMGFVLFMCLKVYQESDSFNLKCIVSTVDGNKYCVRERNKIQLVAELRKSPLHTNVSATIAASRKHYCIHPRISKLADVNSNCKLAVAKSICNYFPQHASLGKEIEAKKNPIMDIEELVNIGRSKPACPYYTMKHIIQKVDIVFCPYNYILNRRLYFILLEYFIACSYHLFRNEISNGNIFNRKYCSFR